MRRARFRVGRRSFLRGTLAVAGMGLLPGCGMLPSAPGGKVRRIGYVRAERPTGFELVVNEKTAQALGLVIPPSVLQQATEVLR